MVLPIETSEMVDQFESFRQEAIKHPGVIEVAASDIVPGPDHTHNNTAFRRAGAGSEEIFLGAYGDALPGYVETLGLRMLAGRTFSRERDAGALTYLINETAARKMGWTAEEAVGHDLAHVAGADGEDLEGEIVGVFADAHFNSLHDVIEPAIIGSGRPDLTVRYLPVRIRPEMTSDALAFLEETWSSFQPGYPFRFFFMDQDFATFYEQEERLVSILGYFTLLAILISCLGLFGLSSFITSQRTKEIGVRKVLGASVVGVVVLLSKDFTRLVLVAAVIGFPLGYLAMSRWLQEFAYATEIGWLVFVATGLATLLIAWSTVGWQSMKAAIADPVRSLRYE